MTVIDLKTGQRRDVPESDLKNFHSTLRCCYRGVNIQRRDVIEGRFFFFVANFVTFRQIASPTYPSLTSKGMGCMEWLLGQNDSPFVSPYYPRSSFPHFGRAFCLVASTVFEEKVLL